MHQLQIQAMAALVAVIGIQAVLFGQEEAPPPRVPQPVEETEGKRRDAGQRPSRLAAERDREAQPHPGEETERRARHLMEAAEHLEQAGFPDPAREFRQMAQRMMNEWRQERERSRDNRELREHLEKLQNAVADLERQNAELRKKIETLPSKPQ